MRLDGRRGNPFRVESSKRFRCVFPRVSKQTPGLNERTLSALLLRSKAECWAGPYRGSDTVTLFVQSHEAVNRKWRYRVMSNE
jgi:hypothetical protein